MANGSLLVALTSQCLVADHPIRFITIGKSAVIGHQQFLRVEKYGHSADIGGSNWDIAVERFGSAEVIRQTLDDQWIHGRLKAAVVVEMSKANELFRGLHVRPLWRPPLHATIVASDQVRRKPGRRAARFGRKHAPRPLPKPR